VQDFEMIFSVTEFSQRAVRIGVCPHRWKSAKSRIGNVPATVFVDSGHLLWKTVWRNLPEGAFYSAVLKILIGEKPVDS
jgi:hypothetical protein